MKLQETLKMRQNLIIPDGLRYPAANGPNLGPGQASGLSMNHRIPALRRRHGAAMLAAGALLVGAMPALAETVYVNDVLRVNVREAPGRTAESLGVVITGMELEVLEHRDGYVKIRAPGGLEGWMKDDYVSTEKPSAVVAEELTQQSDTLRSRVAELEEQLAAAREDKAHLGERITQLETRTETSSPASTPAPTPSSPSNDVAHVPPDLRFKLSGETLPYWIGGILFIALLGFISGISWYKNRVSRRLGGLEL